MAFASGKQQDLRKVMNDYIVRVIAKGAGVRALAAVTTDLVNEAARRHETSAVATAALGHAITGAALIGALLKVRQRVAIKYDGQGPLRKVVVESDAYGKVRGYVLYPDADVPPREGQADVVRALGAQGILTVVRDVGLKELMEGVVLRGEAGLADDLERFLNQSDQTPSLVEIGVHQEESGAAVVAGGLLLQLLPPYNQLVIDELRERLQELPPFTEMLLAGRPPEAILAEVLGDIEHEVLEHRPVRFQCYCSRQRTEKALLSLGPAEIRDIIETQGETVVDCHFCRESYPFSQADLEALLAELDSD